MRHCDSPSPRLIGAIVAFALALSLSDRVAEAKCALSFVEIVGSVQDSSGAPIAGATVVTFVDTDPSPLFELQSSNEVAVTDGEGRFEFRGTFINYAWPRWWHRFSLISDQCGREPREFTLVVQAEGHFGTRIVVETKDSDFQKVEPGSYVLRLVVPIALAEKRAA